MARELDSRALQADSTQTTLCTYLSAILLLGLVTTPSSVGGGPTPSQDWGSLPSAPRRVASYGLRRICAVDEEEQAMQTELEQVKDHYACTDDYCQERLTFIKATM